MLLLVQALSSYIAEGPYVLADPDLTEWTAETVLPLKTLDGVSEVRAGSPTARAVCDVCRVLTRCLQVKPEAILEGGHVPVLYPVSFRPSTFSYYEATAPRRPLTKLLPCATQPLTSVLWAGELQPGPTAAVHWRGP